MTDRPPTAEPARRTLILGGARSGKSGYAEALAAEHDGPVRYLATAVCDPGDLDFAERIAQHRERRPTDWSVLDGADPATVLTEPIRMDPSSTVGVTLIDDIGTWLTGRLDAREAWDSPRGTIAAEMDSLVNAVAKYPADLLIVTPEVGMGIIPATRSGRLFRDEIGTLNQRLAQACDHAVLVVAGIPLHLK